MPVIGADWFILIVDADWFEYVCKQTDRQFQIWYQESKVHPYVIALNYAINDNKIVLVPFLNIQATYPMYIKAKQAYL